MTGNGGGAGLRRRVITGTVSPSATMPSHNAGLPASKASNPGRGRAADAAAIDANGIGANRGIGMRFRRRHHQPSGVLSVQLGHGRGMRHDAGT